MAERIPFYLFDRRDYRLLEIVDEVVAGRKEGSQVHSALYGLFHAEGIKELAESKGMRIAFATISLLQSLTAGGRVEDRLSALLALRQEVLDTAAGSLPRNTARVLLQIMKELVRAGDDQRLKLELAHDFRAVTSGKPSVIRAQLKKYHLLEMPEAWNQIAFDDHVHDANTKGRKTPTHLIMDAWIKGIRRLRVIYYYHIASRSATELIQAAAIMGITLRIGIEIPARFRGKYVQLIWVPRGFADEQAFLCFLAEPQAAALMAQGREVAALKERSVLSFLHAFNTRHRAALRDDYGIDLPELSPAEFLAFVAPGQASMLHLAKFIHRRIAAQLPEVVQRLRQACQMAQDDAQRESVCRHFDKVNALDAEKLMALYLHPSRNPDIPDPDEVPARTDAVPELLRLAPSELVDRLRKLYSGYRFTLNLSNLRVEDVIEILYDCEGRITRLETFNLKDYTDGIVDHIPEIIELQQVINQGNIIGLKRIIQRCIGRLSAEAQPDRERIDRLETILHDIITFKAYYAASGLAARIGSDSTGGSPRYHGMGLVVIDTLPKWVRRQIVKTPEKRLWLPIMMEVAAQTTYRKRHTAAPVLNSLLAKLRELPGFGNIGLKRNKSWLVEEHAMRMVAQGNIVTLGGIHDAPGNHLRLEPEESRGHRPRQRWRYMNSLLKNFFKVVLGFLPALATFVLTKDWWLLAYGGAFIWFGITGLRNIVQSVLGGGGWRRSPLLRWNDLISWGRVTDSLLYTGFSVPLLDYVTKTVILDRLFHITTETHPFLLYSCMALANGVYLVSHNLFRGFPKGTAFANFFRSILSIPIAIALNGFIGWAIVLAGYGPAAPILQKWAAIISKTASDVVAGIIEGTTDRIQNIERRRKAVRYKFSQILDTYAQMEMLLPEIQVAELLKPADQMPSKTPADAADLAKGLYVHALDLLYFWMYQPRARIAMRNVLREFLPDERKLLMLTQQVLQHQRPVSTLFIEGMLGTQFSRPLAFYLSQSGNYLTALQKMLRHDIPGEPIASPDEEPPRVSEFN